MGAGDVYLGFFPFGGSAGRKLRPVLLLSGPLGSVPEVLVAYMTSIVPPVLMVTDILIDPARPEHAVSGLKDVTLLRLHKLATIHNRDVVRQLGTLSATVMTEVESRLRALLNL